MDEITSGLVAADRAVLRVGGAGARAFLQGLVSNDVARLDAGPVYAALLTPQGKYLFDFFLIADGEDVLVDVASERAAALAQRLAMYRLRAPITIALAGLEVAIGLGSTPPGAVADPRHPALGWRAYPPDATGFVGDMVPLRPEAMTELRVEHGVPGTGAELVPDDSYILEMGFERLNGVDFRKGCYVGQEVTARMKHKTDLRKGLVRVRLVGDAPPPGAPILMGQRQVGKLFTTVPGRGLAHLRFDAAGAGMQSGSAEVWLED